MKETFDIAIIGGGISGFTSAMRLQNKGYKTIVFEAHGQLGGCAGFFTKKGFSFDVGATTLVDFGERGVGWKFFKELGLTIPKGTFLDYKFWLPDKSVTLYQDREKWKKERISVFGASANHTRFWRFMDQITDVFWQATRKKIKLPIQSLSDVYHNIASIGLKNIYLLKYMNDTMLDILKKYNLSNDQSLCAFLSGLIEDTVHSSLQEAPFINSALGTTIRGAGLMRLDGGMKKLWDFLASSYQSLGGTIKKGHTVKQLDSKNNIWRVSTSKGLFSAKKIISSLPLDLTKRISPAFIQKKIDRYYKPQINQTGGAIVIFLGVPDAEVANQPFKHHQLITDYDKDLGYGNNPIVFEVGTPKTYEKYTKRQHGAVGGFKQTIKNSNLYAIPQNIGVKSFYLVGDNTWPGLGTVAGVLSSELVSRYFK